jgi:type IV pilus assembly protein PilX
MTPLFKFVTLDLSRPLGGLRLMENTQNKQHGFVLIVALIVLAAMSLAAVALVRTVDTSTLLARSISFKRDAINRNEIALEAAAVHFRSGGALFSPNSSFVNNSAINYSAVMLDTDSSGIPNVLKSTLPVSGSFAVAPVSTGQGADVVYVIERMCSRPGDQNLSTPAASAIAPFCTKKKGSSAEQTARAPRTGPAYYRITTRVTDNRNNVSYAQATLLQEPVK